MDHARLGVDHPSSTQGTTFQSVAKGPWSGGIPSNSGVITFEDPNNEMSGGTLAIGGGNGSFGTGGTVNGNTFHGFIRAPT